MRNKLAILLGLAAFAAAAPALAGDDGGFFVGVEAKFLKPSNIGSTYVLVDPDLDFTPEGTLQSVEFSNAFSPKLWIGGSYDGTSGWAVSYWTFDEDETDQVANVAGGELGDILAHPSFSFEFYTGTATAKAKVEADTLDLLYWSRVKDDEKFKLTWMTGFRYASLDNMLDVTYDDGFFTERYQLMSEADGVGLTGGLMGSVRLGEGWYLVGGVNYSMLMGGVDSSTLGYFEPLSPGDADVEVSRDDDRVLTMMDINLAVAWKIGDKVSLRLGYEMSQWNDSLDRNLFPDDVSPAFLQAQSYDVTFDGASLGVGVSF